MIDLGDGLVLPAAQRVLRFASREAWLAFRRQGIGGSDVARLVGASPDGSEWSVWATRRGRGLGPTPGWLQALYDRGNREEPRVLEDLASETGARVVGPLGPLVVVGPRPIQVTPDAFVRWTDGEWGGGEAKTDGESGWYRRSAWGPSGETIERWTPAAGRIVREDYAAQCYAGLLATGLPWWILVVRLSMDDLRWYRIMRDERLQAAMLARCATWWQMHIVEGVEPEIDESRVCFEAMRRLYPQETRALREATDDEAETAAEWSDTGHEASVVARSERVLQSHLLRAIGTDRGLKVPGGRLLAVETGGGTRLDVARLRKERPEIYREYLTTTERVRTLRFYPDRKRKP